MAKKDSVDVPASNTVKSILTILKTEGYIEAFKLIEDKKQGKVRIYLKYVAGKSAVRSIKRASRPGLRLYVRHKKVPVVLRGRGLAIISTSQGIMSDKDAREKGLGGEIIGYVW